MMLETNGSENRKPMNNIARNDFKSHFGTIAKLKDNAADMNGNGFLTEAGVAPKDGCCALRTTNNKTI